MVPRMLLVLFAAAHLHAQSITVGVIGDQTGSSDLQASYAVLQQGVAELSRQNVDVVLHTGDLVESTRGEDEVRALFAQAAGILDRLPVRWYLTAGDHDVNPPAFRPDSPDRSRERLFQQLYGARVPAFARRPYYSFDHGRYHFIALYSHQALNADPRFGNIFLARIEDDQLAFLRKDLDEHRNAAGIIVFIHQALWYHAAGWQRVHELLRQYPVAAVISGHHHYDQDYGTLDGIRYLTVGATGGSTKNGSRDAGDVHHVTTVRVSGNRVTGVRLLSLSDTEPLALTPRVDMDRVQALDVQLDNLFDFAARNPLFVKDGRLVKSCATGEAARIEITPLGNPIDVPLRVTIAFNGTGGVALSGPAFTAGQCRQSSASECTLARSARTFLSNDSSVEIDRSTPLWSTGLAGTAEAGAVLTFTIRTAFEGASGELFLEKDAAITVQPCS